MPTLSLHHLTMIEAHPLQLIEAAAAGRFDHCGIRLAAPRPGDPLIDIAGDAETVRQVGRRLKDAGVTLLDIEAIWLGPDTSLDALRLPLEVGASLGAKYVLVVGNDDDRTRLADYFARLCDLAAGVGLTVMLEFITYCSIGSPPAAGRMPACSSTRCSTSAPVPGRRTWTACRRSCSATCSSATACVGRPRVSRRGGTRHATTAACRARENCR